VRGFLSLFCRSEVTKAGRPANAAHYRRGSVRERAKAASDNSYTFYREVGYMIPANSGGECDSYAVRASVQSRTGGSKSLNSYQITGSSKSISRRWRRLQSLKGDLNIFTVRHLILALGQNRQNVKESLAKKTFDCIL
jgi:hypothetical protein